VPLLGPLRLGQSHGTTGLARYGKARVDVINGPQHFQIGQGAAALVEMAILEHRHGHKSKLAVKLHLVLPGVAHNDPGDLKPWPTGAGRAQGVLVDREETTTHMELVLVLSELIIDIVDRLPSLLRHQSVELPFHNTSTHLSKTPRTPKNKTLWSMMCVQVCCSKGQIKIVRVIILVFFRILFFSPHPSSHCRRVLYLSYDCFSIALFFNL
jgi:hypothetical protein